MKSYRDTALVIRCHKLAEADRIITVLTRSHGVVRAVAKGVRRTNSRFGSRLEPFMYVDVQFHRGRNLDTVTQVELVEPFGQAIAADYDSYTAATAMAETALRLSELEEHSRQQFLLLLSAIRSLCRGEHPPRYSLDAYLLRAVALAGWAPSLRDCAQCGNPGPHRAFSADTGGVVCTTCRPPGSALQSSLTVEHIRALLEGDWVQAHASPEAPAREASRLIGSYVEWHLERRLNSLAAVERA